MAQLEEWQVWVNISAEQPTLSLSGACVAKPDNTPLCIAPTFLVSLPSPSSSHTWICISQRRSVHLNPYFQLYFLEDLGYGTPLQYSCLETPMDRGAW